MRYFYAFFSWTSTCILFFSFLTHNPKILIQVDKTTFEVHEIINSNVLFYFPKAYCAKTVQWVKMFSKRVYILSSTKLHFHDIITLVQFNFFIKQLCKSDNVNSKKISLSDCCGVQSVASYPKAEIGHGSTQNVWSCRLQNLHSRLKSTLKWQPLSLV